MYLVNRHVNLSLVSSDHANEPGMRSHVHQGCVSEDRTHPGARWRGPRKWHPNVYMWTLLTYVHTFKCIHTYR